MAENARASAASRSSPGTAQHQHILLQKQLTEVRMENAILRQQLYQVSALLDIAVSKLDSMGVSLETPIDIRALRSEALLRAHAEAAQSQYDANGVSPASGDTPPNQHHNKKFQMRKQLREHTKAVQCCAFCDGDDVVVATAGMDCHLIVHNYVTGEKLWDVVAHDEAVSDVSWMDHHTLLSASYDNTVRLWDVNGGNTHKDVLFQYTAHGFVLSAIPLGPSLFVCADSRQKTAIVDTRFGGKGVVQEHDCRINTLSYDEVSHQLLMGQSNGIVSIWDIRRSDQAVSTSAGVSSVLPLTPPLPLGRGSMTEVVVAVEEDATTPAATLDDVPGSANGGISGAGTGMFPSISGGSFSGAPRLSRVAEIENEPSHSAISFIGHFHSDDDTRRLVCVSGDNMVRLYRGSLDAYTGGSTSGVGRKEASSAYVLRNVLAGVPSRGNVMRTGFWKGERGKAEMSTFFDDGEMDAVARPPRRLTECDLLVTGGPDSSAQVFDVTDEGSAVVLERLEGHRDRVTGATVRRSRKPIIATMSSDSTVCIWAPVKS